MKRITTVCLALVLGSACDALKKTTPSEPPPTNPNAVVYTAVGASDAIGYGSSNVCIPFVDCPNGSGYVQVMTRRLQASGKTVTLLNLGIPGAVLAPGTQAIGNQLGRDIFGNFLEREVPFVAKDSTVVTVFAGANDANTIGAALEGGLGGADATAYITTQTQNFARDMKSLVSGIKDRAPQARIVILNLPNLAGLPYANGYTLTEKRALQQISVGFSAQINALAAQNVIIVDIMCDSAFYQPAGYFSDGFHPNDSGYQHLADIMYPAVSAGTATAPRASCSQMTLF